MSAVHRIPSITPARGVWHTIRSCQYCHELFGTDAALAIHKPGKCRTEQTLLDAGAWQGYAGVWWTVDSGLNDAFQTVTFRPPKSLKTNGANFVKAGISENCPDPSKNVTRARLCASCRREFPATRKDVKFCSTACRQKAYRRRRWLS